MKTKSILTNAESRVGDVTIKYVIADNGQISATIVNEGGDYLGNANVGEGGDFSGVYFKVGHALPFDKKKEIVGTILSDLEKVITDKE